MCNTILKMDFDTALFTTAGAGILNKKDTLLNCANVAKEMLTARGYECIKGDVTSYGAIEYSMENTTPLLTGSFSNRCRPDSVVYFFNELKVGVKIVRDLLEKLDATPESVHLILVSVQGSTSSRPAHKMDHVEFLTYKQMSFNITKHVLVPKHTYIDKEQADVIINSFTAKPENFPMMLSTDAMAVFCHFKIGDLIRIDRSSMGGVTEGGVTYRLVVSPN
ncbi:putative DNA-directed RNA polymerase subunit [Emiliania huxleyi virus 18]|nr:putative DNA-directed RNA polymerase subunit [Emiliania huxleyi virus 18]AHA55238.1 putative DNA-directed RNA polymerase subunit [Emiliania huxleyi virus 156]